RAREFCFRNVCATSVYVGHAGSRSFGAGKRSLVVRNLAIAEQRYPTYRADCAAFLRLDPLHSSRQAIERAMQPRTGLHLLVTSEGAVAAVALERARALMRQRKAVHVLTVRLGRKGSAVMITDPAGCAPQSLAFDIATQKEMQALVAYLRASKASRIEIVDP